MNLQDNRHLASLPETILAKVISLEFSFSSRRKSMVPIRLRGEGGKENIHESYAVIAWLCIAVAISFIRAGSFSIAFPITITSAPALQLR